MEGDSLQYGFSVATSARRQRGYILIPGMETAHVAPVINIGMSAPEWIKFLTAFAYYEKTNLENETELNNLIFNETNGMFFQGLKWRIQDPSDAAGFGIGIVTLSDAGILATRNPERFISIVSQTVKKDINQAFAEFVRIFNPRVIAKSSPKELKSQLKTASSLREPKRTDAIITITVRLIRESLKTKKITDQNEFAGSIYDFLLILKRLGIDPMHLCSEDLATLLCTDKPGKLQPHLLPEDVAVIIHEFVYNHDAGGLPIAMSFIVADILGVANSKSPEIILGEAYRHLPSKSGIERYTKDLYKRIQKVLNAKGFSCKISEAEFTKVCSYEAIRKEAVWWEYNVTLGRLEELMRDFVSPYRWVTPWSGTFRQEFTRLAANTKWLREATVILQNSSNLAKNVSSNSFYHSVIVEPLKLSWFNELQKLANARTPLDSSLKRLWELADIMSQLSRNPVATYDTGTDRIILLRDPRESDPYIQRSIVFTWLRKFSVIWE
jgi:hypothetical protein